ncbi:uncharacterized protein LOC120560109 isoform X2 [Perca fluviatilis]|uniref:uncharacterized protein LOC120560109 isoform X2 n=1 Tax=Perca fluviatilis TaxID=8168 RepID=UPI0019652763|nr:uncharacterized protein LOC120560109 isoform X2 [Perca fluviatilis]
MGVALHRDQQGQRLSSSLGGTVVWLCVGTSSAGCTGLTQQKAHCKYAVFKSTLAGAVMAYNRTDLELLIKAIKAKNPAMLNSVPDNISRGHLKHHVRRVRPRHREDDEMWASQQRHLECIQDPQGMIMYRLARTADINNVDVPFYKCLRGSNSLEGFHKTLPHMIPARPYQVYLISGVARWNSDRSSGAVFGGRGRH